MLIGLLGMAISLFPVEKTENTKTETTTMAVKKDTGMVFPTIDGWTKKGAPAVYTEDNLYEYIDGAAEIFLSYDFQSLSSLTYENGPGSFSVDIYRHSTEKNGFGIYSQEKPQKNGDFMAIGTEGYYEKGVLNFLKGCYYVKISGYDLGDNDREVLTRAAKTIADKLEGAVGFPLVVNCFPKNGKVPGSEKYIAQNFLGHSFLNGAFTADYEAKGQPYQVFIIESEKTDEIIKKYRDFVKSKGMEVIAPDNDKRVRFTDPYYQTNGTMTLKWKGNYIWGLLNKDESLSAAIIDQMEKRLVENKLI